MKLYLVSIKSYQLDQGIDWTAFSEPQLERTLLGTKRDDNEPTRLTRTPLTHSHLVRLLNHLQIHDYNDTVTRAALTPAFACFWLIGEFTYFALDPQIGPAFPNLFLTKSSIRPIQHDDHIELTLPPSKADPLGQGIQLIIASCPDEACPGRAM